MKRFTECVLGDDEAGEPYSEVVQWITPLGVRGLAAMRPAWEAQGPARAEAVYREGGREDVGARRPLAPCRFSRRAQPARPRRHNHLIMSRSGRGARRAALHNGPIMRSAEPRRLGRAGGAEETGIDETCSDDRVPSCSERLR